MRKPPKAELRTIYAFLFSLVLAVWFGSSIMIDFFVVPRAFMELDRNAAIDLGAYIFRRWNFTECLLGVIGLLFAFAMGLRGWGTRSRHIGATALTGVMLLVSLSFLLVLTPTITHKVESLRQAGLDFSDLADQPPGRRALRDIHTVYGGLDVLKILCGIILFWLYASRRRRW